VGLLVDKLNKTCDGIKSHVLAAKQESAPVMEEATVLMARRDEAEAKRAMLEAFRSHFIMSDADLTTLTSSTEPVNEHFFTVLARVKQIHKDCEILLGYENQRLGLELMEQTTRNLDAGFKKLYTWIQREFKGLDLEDPHISGSIRRALRVLSERPTLFQNCLDFFAQARESTLSEAFQAALTGTGSSKAIEFSAHDPLRYVGDMLAWVHSAAVSEKEALEGLFISDADEISKALSAGKASEPWARLRRTSTATPLQEDLDGDGAFDGRKSLNDLVSRNVNGLCQTLQNRIQIAGKNADDSVLIYKIYNLLTFYRNIFTQLIGSESSIARTISQLEESTLALFEDNVEEETAAAIVENPPNGDLMPPVFLQAALTQLLEIIRVRGTQITDTELERLFSATLSRVLDTCLEHARQLTSAREGMIYKMNYLSTLASSLRTVIPLVEHVQIPLRKAEDELESTRVGMVESITASLLEESGVSNILQETDMRKEIEPRRRWLMENLEEEAHKLDDFLASGLMDAQDSQKHLVDKELARRIVTEAVDRFCAEYDELESMLQLVDTQTDQAGQDNEGEEKTPLLQDLYPRTGAEVRALLS
jgi:hypothetical protein